MLEILRFVMFNRMVVAVNDAVAVAVTAAVQITTAVRTAVRKHGNPNTDCETSQINLVPNFASICGNSIAPKLVLNF